MNPRGQDAGEALARKLEQLPDRPGVYLFRDGDGALLYVGKARSLRARVRSYFQKSADGRLASYFIARRVRDLEFLVTRSEKEALLLENNLIKKLKPRYNLRLRDDKTFLSLRIDPRERFPKLVPTRRAPRDDGALHFGPYASAGALRRVLRFLRSFVPLRDCRDSDFRTRTRPCLEHEIGRCGAPCVGLQDEPAYRANVERAVRILRGDAGELIGTVRQEMAAAAAALQYERAAALRDFLKSLEVSLERQQVEELGVDEADAVGVWRAGGLVEVVVLAVREGRVVGSAGWTFDHDLADDELLAEFLSRFYGGGRPIPREVILPALPYGATTLEDWLGERRGAAFALRAAPRGPRARLVEMARENARLALLASTDQRRRTAQVLDELQQTFGLERPPLRIVGFDVSTTGGQETVASAVEFRDGEPRRSRYRRYRIRGADPRDEYASMAEALRRHLRRARDEQDLPDLLVVDGGKGQWNAARAVLDELGVRHVDLLALAKGGRRGRGLTLAPGEEERVFARGEGEGTVLPQGSPVLQLLQRLRDEAHRFAIRFHRERRARTSLASELDAIPLLGPARKRKLLERFGDVEGIRRASEEEIAGVAGIGKRAAREVHRWFHQE